MSYIIRVMNPLLTFEARVSLTPTQAALLLGVPRPTYYQYRRTGIMPGNVVRTIEFLGEFSDAQLDRLIRKYVHGN